MNASSAGRGARGGGALLAVAFALAAFRLALTTATVLAQTTAPGGPEVQASADLLHMDGIAIEVKWARKLARRQAQIDRIERIMEERWRRYRSLGSRPRGGGLDRFAHLRHRGLAHAGERLIPRLRDYSMANLLKAATVYNLRRVAPEFRGRIVYRIKTLKVANHPVAFLGADHSFAVGRVKVYGGDGRVLLDRRVSINLNEDVRVAVPRDGPELVFYRTEAHRRVGPLLVRFVERSLELVWPDRRARIVGPVFIRLAGPGQRIITP